MVADDGCQWWSLMIVVSGGRCMVVGVRLLIVIVIGGYWSQVLLVSVER